MRRVLASVLCGLAASSLSPVLAEETLSINPNPIFIAMPAPASMPTIIAPTPSSVESVQPVEEKTATAEAPIKTKKLKVKSKDKPKAIAQNSGSGDASTSTPAPQPTGSFPKTGISGQFEKIGKFGASLPKRLPPTLICALGGTPIALVRHTISATKEGVKDIVGESKFPLFVAPAVCVSFPYGLCAGVIAAPVVGLSNGWKYSDDKPFSKDAFSIHSDK